MATTQHKIETRHTDMIHDAQFDYYGKRVATCSSDGTITVYDVAGNEHTESAVLTGHTGPVWEIAWAHPKFGNMIASCGYDHQVIVHKETAEHTWSPVHYHRDHESSVNSVAWGPHEHGLVLACASSDGKVSVLIHKDDNAWNATTINDSTLGCNSVTWAPYSHLGSVEGERAVKRLATGACDNLVRVFKYGSNPEGKMEWQLEAKLGEGGSGHRDWVRDVAWAPSSGMPCNVLASCSEDKTVIIWTQREAGGEWTSVALPEFGAPVWRVSWSITGNTLAVSSGDQKVTLWSESLDGKWMPVSSVTEAGAKLASESPAGAGSGVGAGAQ